MSSEPRKKVKKLVSVFATSMPVPATRKEAVETAEIAKAIETAGASEDGKEGKGDKDPRNLIRISYIRYPITFWRKFVLTLFDSDSEVNTIYLTFTQKLELPIRPTDV